MRKLRVLFVDDIEVSIGPAMKWVKESHDCDCIPFDTFETEIEVRQPHIIIIDRFQGTPVSGSDEGSKVFDMIWLRRFCPVVIYSAFPDEVTDDRERHPFVKHVKKDQDLGKFKEAVTAMVAHAQTIEGVERHIRTQFAVAMREVAPYASSVSSNKKEYDDAVTRHARRRLAALMDQMSLGALRSWEQYIFPPVSKDPKLGDIIRKKDGKTDDVQAFRLVLTPSCDMAAGQSNRTEQILVASCISNKIGLKALGMDGAKQEKIKGNLITVGHRDGILPLPGLKGHFPSMMADLKQLELLQRDDVTEEKTYLRIASIDSPFRELVAWAYLSVACRPGLPVRDFDGWASQIASE
ncbi:MAG: hypothetical protein HYT87_07375 [Nitrospirae bacterium]|nr:hypothetical protein [Nitrospirota bacterium]